MSHKLKEDSRLVLFCFLSSAYFTLYFNTTFLLCAIIVYSFSFFRRAKIKNISSFRSSSMYSMLCKFSVLWFLITFLIKLLDVESDMFTLDSIYETFLFSVTFILKLFTLALIGMCTFIWLSPKEYALCLTWFFSFFSRELAWKFGLISLLIFKFFGDVFALAITLKTSVNYRMRKSKNILKKIRLYFVSLIGILVKKSDAVTISLYARGLNCEKVFIREWQKIDIFSPAFIKLHGYPLLFLCFSFLIFML